MTNDKIYFNVWDVEHTRYDITYLHDNIFSTKNLDRLSKSNSENDKPILINDKKIYLSTAFMILSELVNLDSIKLDTQKHSVLQ
jgi:hypothetical protein